MKRSTKLAALLAVVAPILACGDGSGVTESTANGVRPVTVSLTTPASDDGAVLLSLHGGGITNPQAATSSYRVYFRLVSETEVRVAVFGNLTAGPLFTVQVPDPRQLAGYSAAVREVANRSNELRGSLAGYEATLAAP